MLYMSGVISNNHTYPMHTFWLLSSFSKIQKSSLPPSPAHPHYVFNCTNYGPFLTLYVPGWCIHNTNSNGALILYYSSNHTKLKLKINKIQFPKNDLKCTWDIFVYFFEIFIYFFARIWVNLLQNKNLKKQWY